MDPHKDMPSNYGGDDLHFTDPATSRVTVIPVPYDATTSYIGGTAKGPAAIIEASTHMELYDEELEQETCGIGIHTTMPLPVHDEPPEAMLRMVTEAVSRHLATDKLPVILGGEHSITPAIVEGLGQQTGAQSALGVLVLDAHLDLREEYGCTKASHACASRRILEKDGLAGYASIGIRSGSREEFVWAGENGISYYTARQVREEGVDAVLDRAMERLQCERLYLSIDLDVLDPAYAPAVGNPEPFGLSSWDVQRVIERLAPRLVGLDINELTPAYDRGETALLAARLAREFIAARAKHKIL